MEESCGSRTQNLETLSSSSSRTQIVETLSSSSITQILESDLLTQADSIQTQNYMKEIDQKLLNLPKVQEVISIYEQKDELADQQDNLKLVLF